MILVRSNALSNHVIRDRMLDDVEQMKKVIGFTGSIVNCCVVCSHPNFDRRDWELDKRAMSIGEIFSQYDAIPYLYKLPPQRSACVIHWSVNYSETLIWTDLESSMIDMYMHALVELTDNTICFGNCGIPKGVHVSKPRELYANRSKEFLKRHAANQPEFMHLIECQEWFGLWCSMGGKTSLHDSVARELIDETYYRRLIFENTPVNAVEYASNYMYSADYIQKIAVPIGGTVKITTYRGHTDLVAKGPSLFSKTKARQQLKFVLKSDDRTKHRIWVVGYMKHYKFYMQGRDETYTAQVEDDFKEERHRMVVVQRVPHYEVSDLVS